MTPRPHPLTGAVAQSRRAFFVRAGALVGGLSIAAHRAVAQTPAQPAPGAAEMTSDSYKPVTRPAKPGATPSMDAKQVEAFERNLACPCPCTLDVYTCRTTDFACGISPAVHGDIQRLVDGGYSADEIMAAMTETYGDFILMQPRKEGFNLLAWFAPFAAIGVGAIGIGVLLRSWRLNAKQAAAARPSSGGASDVSSVDATDDELARLAAAVREER